MDRIQLTAANLNKHGFCAQVFDTAEEAKAAALALIGESSVGFGGSITVRDMGIYETLQEQGNAVYWHWKAGDPTNVPNMLAGAKTADVYISSTNALLESGALLNIDGTGNRVANQFYGPPRVIIIAGENKIVANFEEGIARIKRDACPANAKRLNFQTPCALTGKCTDCNSPQRMCNVTTLIERRPMACKEAHVFLVKESLGF